MVIEEVIKRDGKAVKFDKEKIVNAIMKAGRKVGMLNVDKARCLGDEVVRELEKRGFKKPHIEDIQDVVEEVLIANNLSKVAKEYILYRDNRSKIRDMIKSLMNIYEEITFSDSKDSDMKRENANINSDTAMGTMLKYGSESAKKFNLMYLIPEKIAEAHINGDIHIHDLDFYNMTTTCCQIDLNKLFSGGFNTGHGHLREPNDIRSYAALACIAIQSNQNDQHGGQSIPAFDYYMAPGVAKTFVKEVLKVYSIKTRGVNYDVIKDELDSYIKENTLILNRDGMRFITRVLKELGGINEIDVSIIISKAKMYTNEHTYQAMEALIHNLNTMQSRAGSQIPFSSLNYGTDTSEEGRMIIRNLLLCTERGLGNGETPIFPIQIFKLKDGVNYKVGDPNYDLFKLACRVSAKRLFPNFSNLDAKYNAKYYKIARPETEVAYMGCRTRVISNVYDPENEIVTGRGNLSFTTINLPRLGLIAGKGNIDKFFNLLDEKLSLVEEQLLERFKVQCRRKPKNFPFLMGQGIWLGSDKLGPADDISEILRHGTLSIGFIGLAETLVALIGKHHGESKEAQELGLKIVKRIRDFCDNKSKEHKMNFTCLATPAEGLSGRFIKIDKERFGKIEGITDKDYYTNSFHIPVYYPISAFKKIELEAPYHELTNAGHITYIELDGDPSKNLEAFEKVVRYMHDCGIGYGAINHPVDRDPICGYTGIIDEVCPRCGRREWEPMTMEMWRKIMGYAGSAATCGACGDPYEEFDRIPNKLD